MTDMPAEERARRFCGEYGASYVANVDDLIAEQIRQAEAAARKAALEEVRELVLRLATRGDMVEAIRALAESEKP